MQGVALSQLVNGTSGGSGSQSLYTSCRTITGCAAAPNPDAVTHCAIPDCAPQTTYVVWATAKRAGGFTSPESEPDTFNTDKYP